MSKILITGGAGYIGSFMTRALLEKGYEVVVVDSLKRGHDSAIDKRARFIKGDFLDKQFISGLFSEENFDAVIHFAGFISMAESVENPHLYFENNIICSLNLIEEMRKRNVKRFIFSSTAGVYGNPIKIPIPEDHPKNPTNPYGESKLIVEKILHWYKECFGLNCVSLRYFNASGAALDGGIGEGHEPETHLIPNAIKAAISGTEFTLYGQDYDTKDGTCIRDYIHVLDLVEAHILALTKLEKENGEFFYNVGTGIGYSNKQIIDMIKKITGIDFKVKIEQRRPGDATELVADVTKIKKELSFNPKYSDLETIIKTAYDWHRKTSQNKT
ncbi:MAG: UDP-glucose 4-epimerase GalE [Actinobacteria bacterium]|nr:UDP-glucose 4-epimerase GalE [Actinomycetota bacterium]